MTNNHRGEVTLKLGAGEDAKEVTLRPSFDVLAKIETDLGIGMAELSARLMQGKYGYRDMQVIVRRGIQGSGAEVPANLKELLYQTGLPALALACGKFVFDACKGDPKEAPPEGEA
jgi:hypothetical protein